jgi:NRPS condensation-like uncharacterized protein
MERLFTRSPFSVVSVVARIKGDVTEDALAGAVRKAQQRHPNLRVVLVDDEHHDPWFTSEGAGAIPIEVVPRESPDRWSRVVQEAGTVPFQFERRPAIRFILVRSPDVSELVIMCHHILCDGLSMAYLARDLLEHIGDPAREVTVLPDPVPITRETMPAGLSVNPVVKFFIRRINRKWREDPVLFDQGDYELLSEAYWRRYEHQLRSIELSGAQTDELVGRCRREKVTVNTALTAAFAGAQTLVVGKDQHHADVAVAGNLRDRLRRPVGEVMGFYAGAVIVPYTPDPRAGFWENARRLHPNLQARFTDKALFKEPLVWSYLEPAILEAMNFKKLGGLVPTDATGSKKLRDFSQRSDVVQAILKRDKMESPDRVFMGTAVTNLTRMDIPTTYGSLELDRLIMKPGGAFPLASVNLVVGAVTAAGRLSLVLEYVEDNIDNETMEIVKKEALGLLFNPN